MCLVSCVLYILPILVAMRRKELEKVAPAYIAQNSMHAGLCGDGGQHAKPPLELLHWRTNPAAGG